MSGEKTEKIQEGHVPAKSPKPPLKRGFVPPKPPPPPPRPAKEGGEGE